LTTALLMEDSAAFRRVILVQWPRQGLYTVAFATGEARGGSPEIGRNVSFASS